MKHTSIISRGRSVVVLAGMLLAILTADLSFAQNSNDGSVYTRFGLGQRQTWLSAKGQAMGGGGLALSSSLYANPQNPASLSDQILTRFAGGLTYESITTEADGFDPGTLASGMLSGVHLTIPLRINKLGLGFSMSPYTRVSYRIQDLGAVAPDPSSQETSALIKEFNGNGGLYQLSSGVGYRLSPRLSAGASLNFIFGILEEARSTFFNDARFVDRTVRESTRLRGASATLGARFIVPGLPEGMGLVVASTFTLPTTLDGERSSALTTSVGRDTLGTTTNGDVSLPMGFSAGIAFQPERRWTVLADVTWEEWSSLESDFSLPGVPLTGTNTLSDRLRVSSGLEFWPGSGRPFASYRSMIAYRVGAYTDRAYASPLANETIRSVGITGGLSIPSLIPGTTIDLNIDVGQRGQTGNGLVKDRYLRFGLNINFGERWFDRLPLG
ncbi:MAG: OmpP1/FadL family transporter [Rhodothermales bacterium]